MHSFELSPNCSLTPRAAACFYLSTVAVSLAVAGSFAAASYWSILPFAGLELAALGAAMSHSMRRGRRRELIDIDECGLLLTPPIMIADSVSAPGSETRPSIFRGKWSLVHVGGAQCDDDCRERLYATRQVRRSLGRDLPRVQRVYCATEDRGARAFFSAEHPQLVVLDPDESTATSLREAVGDFAAGDVYLVDPLGNLMMHFPKETGMPGMQKDLKKLLRVSRIG